ncbi:MAG: non-canonical purine NTP pyrophosphatase [Oscillospiraceae bacterium]
MTILYGTSNPAKLAMMQKFLAGAQIKLLSLSDMKTPPPEVAETGASPLENARMKADAYFKAYGIPVFSCDSGLYFDDVSEEIQPGVNVRNIRCKGKSLDDDEMIAYYSALARQYGENGALTARYRNAICLVTAENTRFESMEDALSGNPFLLVAKPHATRCKGFPLDSLSAEIASGKYYNDLSVKVQSNDTVMANAFRTFFVDALGDKS